jgi:transposase
MATLSMDLRQRILTSYDQKEGTREEMAHRYRVSLGMVKKLIQQRRHTGDISPRHHRSGRKPKILSSHCQQMRKLLSRKPDLTLEELRQKVGLDCTVVAIHYALEKMGLTYKKRHSGPVNRTGRTSPGHAAAGGAPKGALTRHG